MSQRSRQEYLKRIWPRYQRVGRKHRQLILNEFCTNCEYVVNDNYSSPRRQLEFPIDDNYPLVILGGDF